MSYYFKHLDLPIWLHITDNDVMSIQIDDDSFQKEQRISIDNIDAYSSDRLNELLSEYQPCEAAVWHNIVATMRNKLAHMLLPTPKTIGDGQVYTNEKPD